MLSKGPVYRPGPALTWASWRRVRWRCWPGGLQAVDGLGGGGGRPQRRPRRNQRRRSFLVVLIWRATRLVVICAWSGLVTNSKMFCLTLQNTDPGLPIHYMADSIRFPKQIQFSELDGFLSLVRLHREERRKITKICALPLLLFFGWIPCTGWLDEFFSSIIWQDTSFYSL